MMGKFLPFLQELSNFVTRCNAVALNLVQQLASLISSKEPLYKAAFKNITFIPLFAALGYQLH